MTRSRDDDDWDDDDRPPQVAHVHEMRTMTLTTDRTRLRKRNGNRAAFLRWCGSARAGGAARSDRGHHRSWSGGADSRRSRGLRRRTFQKIKIGMSQKDVEKIFGGFPGKVVQQKSDGRQRGQIRPLGRFQGSSLPMELYGRQSLWRAFDTLLAACSFPPRKSQVRRQPSCIDLLLRHSLAAPRYPLQAPPPTTTWASASPWSSRGK